jgi:hypothetical protein
MFVWLVLGLCVAVLLYVVASDVVFLHRAELRRIALQRVDAMHAALRAAESTAAAAAAAAANDSGSSSRANWKRLPSCVREQPVDFVFNRSRFLPDAVAVDDEPALSTMASELQTLLQSLQMVEPDQCNDATRVLITRMPGYGFSAQLLYLPRFLSYTVNQGYTAATIGKVSGSFAANRSLCSEADVTCVYEPLTTCSENRTQLVTMRSYPTSELFAAKWPLHQLPPRFKALGWFWWAAQTLAFVARPNERLREMVASAKKRLRWEHPMLVMHVRRSDTCRTRATCRPLSEYFDAVRLLAAKYGPIRNIYVATDGSEVIRELKAGNYSSEFDIRWLDWDRSGFDWMRNHTGHIWLEPCHEKGICDGIADMFSMALDYELMADGDYHVGLFTSGAFRLPYALSYARKGCYTPYVSLDIPWCNHWGKVIAFPGYDNIMC